MQRIVSAAAAALCVFLLAGSANAEQATPEMSDEVRSQLIGVQLKVTAINEAQSADQMTNSAASHMRRQYLGEARRIAHRDISLDELMALTGDPASEGTWVPGWLTFINVMWVFGVGLLILGVLGIIIWQLGPFLFELFASIPKEFWEFLMSVGGLSLIYVGTLAGAAGPYIALLGCIMFGASLFIIAAVHDIDNAKPGLLFFLSAIPCAVAAVMFASSMIGFVTVGCIVSSLGFFVFVTPFCTYIGFEDEEKLPNATAASFVMLIAYVILHATSTTHPYVEPFKFGALWLGAFVGYIGLLIMSSRFYSKRNYILRQVVTFVAAVAAIAVGTMLHIDYVAQIGGTFGVLCLIEKIYEIPVKHKLSYAWLTAIAGGLLFGGAWLATEYQDVLGPYFLF